MSKRVVIQQAAMALSREQAIRSKNATVRCFATISTSQADTLTTSRTSTTREYREAKKKEGKLRHAINLYHLTDFFFPTIGESTSTPSLVSPSNKFSKKVQEKKKSTNDDLDKALDYHIRSSIMGSNSPTSKANNFDSNLTLKGPLKILANKKLENNKNSTSVFEDSSRSLSSTTDLTKDIWPAKDIAIKPKIHTNEISLPPLPPVEDQEAVQKYIADNVRRNAARMSRSERRSSTLHNLDVRGAQVVDALYGTVSAQYPGLEVLRERIKEREQREGRRQTELKSLK